MPSYFNMNYFRDKITGLWKFIDKAKICILCIGGRKLDESFFNPQHHVSNYQ